MKKLRSKVAHNRPQTFLYKYSQNQPRIDFPYHKNVPRLIFFLICAGKLAEFDPFCIIFLFNFLFLLGQKNETNMARPGFEPKINQSIDNSLNHWTTKLLVLSEAKR
jgi:hypothetical protein